MKTLVKTRMFVCARGIEMWLGVLYGRADRGDQEAVRALEKLQDAFDTAAPLCGEPPIPTTEDKWYAAYDALRILQKAVDGQSEYPRDMLRRIAERAKEDCAEMGLGLLDIGFFTEPEK